MDNLRIDITSEGREAFEAALTLFGRREAVGYAFVPVGGTSSKMILYWTPSKRLDYHPFPTPLTMDTLARLVFDWLKKTEPAEEEPDHDGSNGRGWRIYNEQWRRVDDQWEAFAAVEPVWAMYGK
jgi:hypothetical protein